MDSTCFVRFARRDSELELLKSLFSVFQISVNLFGGIPSLSIERASKHTFAVDESFHKNINLES
jgi:hypothetical protein